MKRKGFTLIELTIVLSMVVVLSGVLILRVAGWNPRQNLNISARAFGGALRVWRERARFDETSYRVTWKDRGWSVSTPAGDRMTGGLLGSSQTFEAEGEVFFDRRGVAPRIAITLRNTSGDRTSVLVDPLLSDVRYEESK